jgi:hypothetical protein
MFKRLKCFFNKSTPFYIISIVFFIKLLTVPKSRIPCAVLLIYILVIKVISPMLDIIIKLFIINDPTPLKIQQFKEDLQQVGINLKIFLWKIAFSIVVAIILMEFGILDQVYELAKKLTIFIQHNIKATSYSITS